LLTPVVKDAGQVGDVVERIVVSDNGIFLVLELPRVHDHFGAVIPYKKNFGKKREGYFTKSFFTKKIKSLSHRCPLLYYIPRTLYYKNYYTNTGARKPSPPAACSVFCF
jgi:hypothetical protein